MISKVVGLAIALTLSVTACGAQVLVDPSGASVPQGSITNTATSIPSSSTAVTLVAPSKHLCICNTHSTTILYVDLANGTATSADYPISPGTGHCFDNLPSISSFRWIGSAAAGIAGVMAW